MHWLAIHCPTLSLDCILRRWPEGIEPALAVTDLDGSRRFIAVATRAAQAAGVHAGQAVATALALLPDLIVAPRKPDDERQALTEAALAALRFTPTVSLRASGLVMEISASLKLFGGRRALKKSIGAAIRTQGLSLAAAEAPTPHGAWLLALEAARKAVRGIASGPTGFAAKLDALPIGHLETAQHALVRLDGVGCHTVADLRRLPVKGLARRFGTALVDELDRATGNRPDPQVVFEAPSRFDAKIELMARVETADALVFAGQRLLAQMAGWLAARRAAVRGFTLVLHHDRWTRDAIEPTEIPIALATPTHDLARLQTLLRERLSRFELKAPVLELGLAAPAVVDEVESDGSLFPAREEATETLGRLVEKLTARLGSDAMTRIERIADHRPERAWRERTVDAGIEHRPSGKTASAVHPPGPRPAWLLTEPKQLDVRAHRPVYETPLDLLAGPERIETGWWDDAPATRDYFIAENAAGRLVWIYRERLPAPGQASWFLQGLFG